MIIHTLINTVGPFEPMGDPNYPVPGSGTYQTGAQGLNGVTYSSSGTPYIPGSSVNTVPGTPTPGLYRSKYRDKVGNISWNGTNSPGGLPGSWIMTFPTGFTFVRSIADTYVSWGNQLDTPENKNFCCEWKGYFQAPATANFNMFITSDDDSVFWVGTNALDGNYTNSNYAARVSNGLQKNTNTMQLTANKWYPIRIWYTEYEGGCKFQLFAQKADGTKYNGSDLTWAYNSVTGGF
jgi:hypothetical protein